MFTTCLLILSASPALLTMELQKAWEASHGWINSTETNWPTRCPFWQHFSPCPGYLRVSLGAAHSWVKGSVHLFSDINYAAEEYCDFSANPSPTVSVQLTAGMKTLYWLYTAMHNQPARSCSVPWSVGVSHSSMCQQAWQVNVTNISTLSYKFSTSWYAPAPSSLFGLCYNHCLLMHCPVSQQRPALLTLRGAVQEVGL